MEEPHPMTWVLEDVKINTKGDRLTKFPDWFHLSLKELNPCYHHKG